MASIYVFYIIIGKFNYKQEFNLVLFLIIDKHLEIDFYNTIQLYILAINLQIKDC